MSDQPSQSLPAPLRVVPAPQGGSPARQDKLAAVANLCRSLLDAELQFYGQLEQLLTSMATSNLFSTEAATALSAQIGDLQRQRDEMNRARSGCQQALAMVLPRRSGEIRMSELEPHLQEEDRASLRSLRLQVVNRVEGMQRLLQRTDLLLSSRLFLFSDLITALTGQSLSSNCYGANGRHERHVPASTLEAVS